MSWTVIGYYTEISTGPLFCSAYKVCLIIPLFSAVLSYMSPFDDGTVGVFKLEYESDLLFWLGVKERRWNHAQG